MNRKPEGGRRSDCPLSISLEGIGDRWSLLVVRDLMFGGPQTFGGFLAAGEGIATNILADRLRRLEARGIVARRPHPADARRVLYRLTEKGIDLAPVLVELMVWAARHERTAAPPHMIPEMTEHRERFLAGIRRRWEEAGGEAPEPEAGPRRKEE